jgi:hypothetical protein
MKKLLIVVAVFAMTTMSKAFGQPGGKWIELPSSSWGASNAGTYTVQLPDRKGTLTFTKTATGYSHAFKYITINGLATTLEPTTAGLSGAPQNPCRTALANSFYASADKTICLSICDDGGKHTIMLLLPSRQVIREAADN